MDNILYVPILKWKQGEQGALKLLSVETKKRILPLIEVPARVFDFEKKAYMKTIEKHIEKIPQTILKSWNNPFYFDISNLNCEYLSDGTYIYEHFDDNFENSAYLNYIPVYNPDLNKNIKYFTDCIKKDRIIAIRLKFNKIISLSEYLQEIVANLEITGSYMSKIDLIIDIEYIKENEDIKTLKMLTYELNNLSSLYNWRYITLAGTSFPESLSILQKNSYCNIPRTYFTMYSNLINKNTFNRSFLFGDYCISNPKTADDIDPRILNAACNIRYTKKSKYLVVKGISFKKNGGKQYKTLCKCILSNTKNFNRKFSYGDEYIEDCANDLVNTGNPTTWRKMGTIHHITLLVKQLSSFHEIL